MEQTLLEPSRYRITSVSIDSRFADQYYHGTSDFMIRLPSTMRNVMRIAVSSIEVPEVAYVFSAKAGNTTFTVEGVGTFSVAEGNYTPAQLAAAVSDSAGAIGLDCSYNAITNRFAFVATSGGPYTVALYGAGPVGPCSGPCPISPVNDSSRYWGIGYNMGFRDKTIVVSSGEPVVACQSPQTAAPAYTLLQVQCPDMMENTMHRTDGGSFVPALAKLVLRNGFYALQTDDGGNSLRKENVFQSPSSITQLRISLVDAYGRFVEMGDTDWSMTFEIMEVVNSCQYAALNKAYGRC
jgi:hypothetical protein